MDGASKFVRGDAVAGIIIVLVNIIGGLIIGVMQQGMAMADAARTYTLLSVGDGLVTQVPALIVSTAAGMLVTRTTASGELGEEMKKQLFTNPKAIALASIMLFTFALIPGMPKDGIHHRRLPLVFSCLQAFSIGGKISGDAGRGRIRPCRRDLRGPADSIGSTLP